MNADLDIEVEKVDGTVSGNSGQTPPNGNANGQDNANGNNGNGNNGGSNNGSGGNGNNKEAFIFYYHPDHLGSSSYISDANGEVTQHLEYFAFGETFLEEHSNTETTPYLFNGKELDEETGLYYYGARYYDAKTSIWASVDPLVLRNEFYDDPESNNGGVYNSFNLSPYVYCQESPVVLTDPDGECPNCVTAAGGALLGGIIGGGIEAGMQLYKSGKITSWSAVGGSALQGAIVGGAAGFTGGTSLLVTAGVAGGANTVGGTLNRSIQGKKTTFGDLGTDFAIGAAFGAVGYGLGKYLFKGGGSIITSGKQHGTLSHWNTMGEVVESLARKGETVSLNRSINTVLGKTIEGVGNWRPDVMSISKNGVINITEVISPSQTAQQIIQKTQTMATALIKAGYKVTTKVVTESSKAVN